MEMNNLNKNDNHLNNHKSNHRNEDNNNNSTSIFARLKDLCCYCCCYWSTNSQMHRFNNTEKVIAFIHYFSTPFFDLIL